MALAISALKYNYVSIQNPNSGKPAIDLTRHIIHTEYFEDLLSPIITMRMKIRCEFNLIEDVPIRGGEMIAFSADVGGTEIKFGDISDGNIIADSGELYVFKLSDLNAPTTSQDFILNIASLEFIKNETSRCQFKFKSQTIDKHVRQILGPHVMNVNPDKILDKNIEETENSYSFIGNNRKPFYTIEWLCSKAITNSVQGVSGEGDQAQGKGTAGFLFYENREGFNFKSVESLVRSTTLKSNKKKAVFNYVYRGKGAVGNAYDLNENTVINFFYYNKSVDVKKALSAGQYGSLTIFYNSLTQKFSQIEYRLEKEIKDSKLGSEKDLSTPKGLDQYNSRLYSRISDHGVMAVGENGLESSGRDPVDQAKAISRYNALFSQSLNIQVPCNTNLKVGDIINLTFPELKGGKSKDADENLSGNYLISRLNHHMQPNASFTSLNLIRDSYGNSTAYPVDTLQSGGDQEDDKSSSNNNAAIPNLPYLK
tara:strand:+ start:980 stop:2425 length:1446 start_codon:yes stop_codon:yes gene_type:complete